MNKKFNVYVYLDPRKPGKYVYDEYIFDYEPFYVGKGEKYREKKHLPEAYNNRDENSHKCNVTRKIKKVMGKQPIIIFYQKDLEHNDAKNLEIKMIKTIGRYDLKEGPLTNKTNGGDGTTGHIKSKKCRELLSRNHADVSGEKNGRAKKWKDQQFTVCTVSSLSTGWQSCIKPTMLRLQKFVMKR